MKRYLITLSLILTCCFAGRAQQEAQYSQYMFNALVINPAYAGYRETLNVSLLHRDQWAGFQGAPKTQSLIADGAFTKNKNVGLGVAIVNDKAGLLGQRSVYLNYAYRLPVGENNARLSFGLAAGISQYSIDNSGAVIEDRDDPNFLGGNASNLGPDGKFGVHFSNERFYAGVSATNLLSRTVSYQDGTIAKQGRHYFITAGYLLDLNEDLKLKPSFLVRDDVQGPSSVDVTSFLLIKEMVWVGATYRTGVNLWKKTYLNTATINQNSVVGAVEFFVAKKFRLGYAYDYSLSKMGNAASGSHEISLGVVLNANKKSAALLTPRYF
ncbi:MAG TPA: type IX secretion system membrane protein PorP/SprF [Sphingobacteriaceae bacterium]